MDKGKLANVMVDNPIYEMGPLYETIADHSAKNPLKAQLDLDMKNTSRSSVGAHPNAYTPVQFRPVDKESAVHQAALTPGPEDNYIAMQASQSVMSPKKKDPPSSAETLSTAGTGESSSFLHSLTVSSDEPLLAADQCTENAPPESPTYQVISETSKIRFEVSPMMRKLDVIKFTIEIFTVVLFKWMSLFWAWAVSHACISYISK